jgi:hypothetical protein
VHSRLACETLAAPNSEAFPMSQNLISLVITDEQQAAALDAIAKLEAALAGLIALTPAERKSLFFMGPKSEAFTRGVIRLLQGNPRIVPPSLDLAEAQADLAVFDRLGPIWDAVHRICTNIEDTRAAAGSDAMDVALEGYGQLKLSGDAHGLEDLRKELGARFAKSKRRGTAAK